MTALAQFTETGHGDDLKPYEVSYSDAVARAEHFTLLLEAVEADARALGLPEGTAQSWRISAKAAHGLLLNMAEHGNPSSSVRAARAALTHMSVCNGLIL